MINHFTPKELQDFLKSNNVSTKVSQNSLTPSASALNFVFGYAAALTILKTMNFGKVKILLN